MKVLLQRSLEASVTVQGQVIGQISKGLVLLVGLTHDDSQDNVEKMAEKVVQLRTFNDADGKMNLSIKDVEGEILAISQFTLYGDTKKGRRPSFVNAARPEHAAPLMNWFVDCLKARGMQVATGQFGADMKVSLVNDGPVTLMLET